VSAPTPVPSTAGATRAAVAPPDPSQASTGELIGRLSDQLGRLGRDEVRLAQAEVTPKTKRLGIGLGLFGGAGVVALLGAGALVTAAILGLANVLPGWPAAVIVAVVLFAVVLFAVVLFAVAGILALIAKLDVDKAKPPLSTETTAGVQADIDTVKKAVSR
jgi:hypothetical protein